MEFLNLLATNGIAQFLGMSALLFIFCSFIAMDFRLTYPFPLLVLIVFIFSGKYTWAGVDYASGIASAIFSVFVVLAFDIFLAFLAFGAAKKLFDKDSVKNYLFKIAVLTVSPLALVIFHCGVYGFYKYLLAIPLI